MVEDFTTWILELRKNYYPLNRSRDHGMAFVSTVEERKHKYSDRDIKRAEQARRVQDMIGCPSTPHYTSIIRNYLLPNCTVTTDDIKIAEEILDQI